MEALELLRGYCPLLKRIEGLIYCPNINIRLIYDLKREIFKQNFDLLIEE
jgi:hypothetical protein